ncbi:MAG: hypothetical protein GWM90_07035 [Gemmatimonadetes bacterium]|nr:hypothetical protein [Gemmatimonadota bacterium]NIQ53571.1 hypothetical protein [Gemmatimonadota bacterium]NIU73728.1 hypothetical protein [Gammaproteobacteria bacterium]NIX43869.1 hypothetical protein [Gemmatimonadota bacterium]NIY08083.1 hypothetical protein [Gemmatimonadota bacterium]
MSEQRYREQDRRYTRAWRWGLALSALGHVLLFLIFSARPLPLSPFSAAGPRRGDFRAAPGGGMQAVELSRPASARPVPPEPVPTLEPEETEVEPEAEPPDEDAPVIALADQVAVPGTQGPTVGVGLLDGTGRGDGGTEAEGRFRVVPPRPRGLMLPPGDRPDQVRGREVEVWVFVTEEGEVVPDSTRLNPPTGDRGFDRKLREYAADWVFEAAQRDGRNVAEWFRYTLIM